MLNQADPCLTKASATLVSTVGGAPLEVVKQYIENQQTSERDNERIEPPHA